MKYIKRFEGFDISTPIDNGRPLNKKEWDAIGYKDAIPCPELITKDDNYYYIYDHRCESIKDVLPTYIASICAKYYIYHYTITDEFSIDVDGDVDIKLCGLTKIPVVFRDVTGNFDCSDNNLESLKGCPSIVEGNFDCSNNELKTLEFSPLEVFGCFDCTFNQIKTIEHLPTIGHSINLQSNMIESLKGCPDRVEGSFICADNHLTTLEGGPEYVDFDFDCSSNELTTLIGSPIEVGNDFYCNYNKLTTLEGVTEEVKFFCCANNPIESWDILPYYKDIDK